MWLWQSFGRQAAVCRDGEFGQHMRRQHVFIQGRRFPKPLIILAGYFKGSIKGRAHRILEEITRSVKPPLTLPHGTSGSEGLAGSGAYANANMVRGQVISANLLSAPEKSLCLGRKSCGKLREASL